MIESDRRILRHVQIDVALQVNRSGQKLSLRHNYSAAAGSRTGGDCFRESFSAIGATISDGAEPRDVKVSPRKGGRFNAPQNAGGFSPRTLSGSGRKSGRHATGRKRRFQPGGRTYARATDQNTV